MTGEEDDGEEVGGLEERRDGRRKEHGIVFAWRRALRGKSARQKTCRTTSFLTPNACQIIPGGCGGVGAFRIRFVR